MFRCVGKGILNRRILLSTPFYHSLSTSPQIGNYLLSGKVGSGLTTAAISHIVHLNEENVNPSSILVLSNRNYERNRIEEMIDLSCPLSSIETEVLSFSSFIRSITKEYSDILQDDTYRIISEEEQFILFESNREYLLSNSNLFQSNVLTTKSILRNIAILKSMGISPSDYSSKLSQLLKDNSSPNSKRYSDFGTIYSVYDQFLHDRKLLTLSDITKQLKNDECTLNELAKQYSHIIINSSEFFSPIQNDFLSHLIIQPSCKSALITHHTSITYNSGIDSTSFYTKTIPSLQRISSSSSHCVNDNLIQLYDYKSIQQKKKTIAMKDIDEWKKKKNSLPDKPLIVSWKKDHDRIGQETSNNIVYLEEFSSAIEEQEAILTQIKEIFQQPVVSPSPPSFAPWMEGITTESAFAKVVNVMKDTPMNHLIGVVFKTRKEVNQFCSLLQAEGISYRSIEPEQSLFEGINILHTLYDPYNPKASNFISLLQLQSLHLQPATINAFIRQSQNDKTSLFSTIQNQLQNPTICFSQQENDSLQRLVSAIQKLHNQLLQYPGSFLLYRFYEEIQELPLLMASEQRQTSLLQLLNDLLYLEDGRFSLIETPDKTSKQPYNRLYSIINYLDYLPLSSTPSFDNLLLFQNHPLMKLLQRNQYQVNEEEIEEAHENVENCVIVSTYALHYPSYLTDLFLPQLNAGKIPSRQVYTTSALPEGIILPNSQSLEPINLSNPLAHFEVWLSQSLQSPHYSYSLYLQNITNNRLRSSKPSTVIISILPNPISTKHKKELPSSFSQSSSNKLIIKDYDSSSLYEKDQDSSYLLLSVSRMNSYLKCPYSFYLQYILQMTGSISFMLEYGASIHGCIEDLTPLIYNQANRDEYKDRILQVPSEANIKAILNSKNNQSAIEELAKKYNTTIPEDIMKCVMKHYWKPEVFSSPAHEKIMKLHYYNGIVNFLRRAIHQYFKNDSIQPIAIEQEFSKTGCIVVDGKEEKYKMRGIFDRIEGKNGKASCIVDYKSNPSRKDLTEESFANSVNTYYNLQTAVYIDSFKDVYGIKPKAMRFENIESGIQYKVDMKNVNKEIINNTIKTFIVGIREGDFTPCLNEFQCNHCEFRDKCEYWKNKK